MTPTIMSVKTAAKNNSSSTTGGRAKDELASQRVISSELTKMSMPKMGSTSRKEYPSVVAWNLISCAEVTASSENGTKSVC